MCGDYLSARVRLATLPVIVAETFGWAGANPGKCWHNVSQLTAAFGGTFAYGWALGDAGPLSSGRQKVVPLYRRWVNHILWRDENGQLWEVTPRVDELDHTITWEPTHFVLDDSAQFEIASEEICCPQPAVYVALRPGGEWTADCLCQAERAPRETQDEWVKRALYAIRLAGREPIHWRLKRVGDKLRDIWIVEK
jgi:hypothetical protein